MFTMLVVAFLALVLYGVLAALVVEALDASQVPGHDPVCESRGIARVYMRGSVPRVLTQRRRHDLFRRAQAHGMPADALRFFDASMNGARTWKDVRGVVRAVNPTPVYWTHCGPASDVKVNVWNAINVWNATYGRALVR